MFDITKEDRLTRQRDFYIKLLPGHGHLLAQLHGFTVPPSVDSIEAETKDAVELWHNFMHSPANSLLEDACWWMVNTQDPFHNMSKAEADVRYQELKCFAIAVVGQLVDKGLLQWNLPPVSTRPTVSTETENVMSDEERQKWVDLLGNLIKEKKKDEGEKK